MTRNEAKDTVKGYLEQYLRNKGIDTRRPFRCLNPAHDDRHPSMSLDRTSASGPHCKCFACGAYYDIFDIIRIDYGLNEDRQVFDKAYELYDIKIDNSQTSDAAKTHIDNTEGSHMATNTSKVNTMPTKAKTDFTAPVESAHEELLNNPSALKHLQDRGLSMDIIKQYHLGYDREGYNHMVRDYPEHQSSGKKSILYKYIFPYPDTDGKYTYFLSEIEDRSQVDDYNDKYRKINKGTTDLPAQLFNERYIMKDTPAVIFVCEGIYDALSVEDAGGKAIALTGVVQKRFLNLCKSYNPQTTFVLSLDNDDAGRKASNDIATELDKMKIPYIVKTLDNVKDFNEAIQRDREQFVNYIRNTLSMIEQDQIDAEEAERQAYLQTSAAYHLQDFVSSIERSKTSTFYPSGFADVDILLDGGFYPGLYFVGALSSLGKTTFCLQVADNIAATGKDVLVFSLEMSKKELIAKSVSRLSVQQSMNLYGTTEKAKTVRDILTSSRYAFYSDEDKNIIATSISQYSTFAGHLYLNEGVGDIGVKQIRETVEKHIRITGNKPVVIIDYIQILAPYNERMTDKQNTDKAVLELKRISRDLDIPVLGVSSFNRENYTSPVNLTSFKESGAIEYTSDVLIGLQYDGMDYEENETDGKDRTKRIMKLLDEMSQLAKSGDKQVIQLKVLKNRNGIKGDTVIEFLPKYNCFMDRDISTSDERWNIG